MTKQEIIESIKGGLIVSCQALESEPLFSSYIMGRMAVAAKEGGAIGIRANTFCDITEIKKNVDLPVIGIVKREYPESEVYITPTMKEIEELIKCETDIIALDATLRKRPNGETLEGMIKIIRKLYPNVLLMADTSNFEEAVNAERLGFDFIGTTLSGYTQYTKGVTLPNLKLIDEITTKLHTKVIAEGGIWEVCQLQEVLKRNVHAVVIGTAITRPKDITKRFVSAINPQR